VYLEAPGTERPIRVRSCFWERKRIVTAVCEIVWWSIEVGVVFLFVKGPHPVI
jgi:hypothetical protein